jgi:hypothetical protein
MQFETHPTPNPNSTKITVDGRTFIDAGMESFSSAAQAGGHPLGSRLFAIDGIVNVFIMPQFLTVTKAPDADWNAVMTGVEAALKEHFAG